MSMTELTPVARLTRDLKLTAAKLSPREIRYLVDCYYQMQDDRLRDNSNIRSMVGTGEEHSIADWLADQHTTLEKQLGSALDAYSAAHPVGAWARLHHGVGPVISAGLLAHIDIAKAPTVGHIFSFAGVEPSMVWNKGDVRPFNAQLRSLICFKLGESFVKVSSKENAWYGLIYRARKDREAAINEAGGFEVQAKTVMETGKFKKDTTHKAAYSDGKLPPAHLHRRAVRYAAKRFISDLHVVWHFLELGKLPPMPYPFAHMGHVHAWYPPEYDQVPGLMDAIKAAGWPNSMTWEDHIKRV